MKEPVRGAKAKKKASRRAPYKKLIKQRNATRTRRKVGNTKRRGSIPRKGY